MGNGDWSKFVPDFRRPHSHEVINEDASLALQDGMLEYFKSIASQADANIEKVVDSIAMTTNEFNSLIPPNLFKK